MLENVSESVVREKIARILSTREFAKGGKDSSLTDYLANWIKSIIEWIKDKLEGIRLPDMNVNIMPQTSLSPGAAISLKITAAAIIAALIFLILFFILRRLRSSKKVKQEEDALLIYSLKDPDLVLETALSFSKKGDFRQGLRYLYISLILKFNERNIIHIDKSKTNRQYLQEIKNSSFGRYNDMAGFTRAFNDHWYGFKSIDAGVFELWYLKYIELQKEEDI